MVGDFVPAQRPARFPLGKTGKPSTQIQFYERLTDKNCDLRDIAAIVEPVIVSAQLEPVELCDVITKVTGI